MDKEHGKGKKEEKVKEKNTERERRESKRSRKENITLKDFALDGNLLDLEPTITLTECGTCEKLEKGGNYDACGTWECLKCDPHDSRKKRKSVKL